ncbi:hypothetical protein, partial [Massilia aquatica]|uniref:hypothetical protein n=1 Tax=Massilia aquatica TaxID=2609000 RepID=UPI001A7E6374
SFEPLPASGWDRMSSAFLLPCITPQMVDFPPIEVSEQIRPQQFATLGACALILLASTKQLAKQAHRASPISILVSLLNSHRPE